MNSISFADVLLWGGALLLGGLTLYHGALISGFYKDPLLARFRRYGEERRPAPALSFLVVLGMWCMLMAIIARSLTQRFLVLQGNLLPLVFFVLAAMAFSGAITVARVEALRVMLPRWYFDLLLTASREERRLIAYAWLRLPRKMRWHLNGDQAAFRVWADMVRLTIIYGARDPDDPWAQWV